MAKKTNIVKKTKGNLNLLLIVLVVVGWVCAIVKLTDNTAEKEQLALIENARGYMEDKLYIRAVNNYEKALNNYQFENNLQYETELLAIYKEAGMMTEYYELIDKRMEAQTAEKEEYTARAQAYIEEETYKAAINTLKNGIAIYNDEEMIQLKESIIYQHSEKVVDVAEFKQPGESWMIPTFNGEKWGYANKKGKKQLTFDYDEVTPFAGDYAVVKLNGVYTLIDQNGYWNAIDEIGLDAVADITENAIIGVKDGKYQLYSRTFKVLSEESFENIYANDNGSYMVQKNGKWAMLSGNLEPITDYIFTDVAVNSKGRVFAGDYAVVKDEKGYFLINANGEAMYETRFANAKGFEGGIYAVADANNKWGFANEKGEMTIDYQYTDAKSFSCKLGAVQHAGKWGYINKYNNMMIEAEYEDALPFIDGSAIVKNKGVGYTILTLKYYDLF